MNNTFYINKNVSIETHNITGELIRFDNETYYKISNSHTMRPFFMSIVSDSNHWLFMSSNGGLTAGRKNSDAALFPYYTDDKITESVETTGSKAIFHIAVNGKLYVWEPFSIRQTERYNTRQNIYKNSYGNKVVFEEVNEDLDLSFRVKWCTSNEFGFVKTATLINHSASKIEVSILDGLQNILPSQVGTDLQNATSNLVDAYKRSELKAETGIGIYALSAVIVDKAEPSEALKANTVWSFGLERPKYLLSALQLDDFRQGLPVFQEQDIKAEKGAYFIVSDITLESQSEKTWGFVANVNQSIANIVELSEHIKNTKNLKNLVQDDIDLGTKNLIALAGASDGLQRTQDSLTNTRHFANTLFNIMRGGIFDNHYQIERDDFIKYIRNANTHLFKIIQKQLNTLPEVFSLKTLQKIVKNHDNKDFKRLGSEYLPLKFSRRHGDPSRPWNKFSINTRSEIDGSKILDYQGNWRDIFQNWEALTHAYPEFIEGMIHKFLNATTFDGYNPYRVTKGGFDWEVIEKDDPWSYIGYWGDHQIIYLLKFLEFIEKHYPKRLEVLFNQDVFVYANVPYKIKPYKALLENPKDTIDFDHVLDKKLREAKQTLGADAALLRDKNDTIYYVNLIEKLLATVLSKVSNFIPESGIWLNTQRPEWNDANNALVGNGVSMVTLYYLERFIRFFETLINNSELAETEISAPLKTFFDSIVDTLALNTNILAGRTSDKDRKSILDGLGQAGSVYRKTIYKKGFSSKKETLNKSEILQFTTLAKHYLEHSIVANKRPDNLYHAYNLMSLDNANEISISHLPEMLEGQVAVLSSGVLSAKEALAVLDALKQSALFRPDQYSYILYPNKSLPRFEDKNTIPNDIIKTSSLIQALLKDNNRQIIEQDVLGQCHFNSNFNNVNDLKAALKQLPKRYKTLQATEDQLILNAFEQVFNHKAFTGRSGTFFGYEGLGSIYWHMVSKLLLAVQENCILAIHTDESEDVVGKLLEHYYEIQAGIGVHKPPQLYGAFPTDPYSHTPATKGAQQPGMTGQVKEDILCRIGELGVFVNSGKIHFKPELLRKSEFLTTSKTFKYNTINNIEKTITLEPQSLCFTYCQIPIIYKLSDKETLKVVLDDAFVLNFDHLVLDSKTSKSIFERIGNIERIEVSISNKRLK